jgi:DNA-binding FadR family transcriptional regulator
MSLEVLTDLIELRRIIAVEVLGLVTERATDEELCTLREAHRGLAAFAHDSDAFMAADLDFGRRIVRATHNLALELLFNTIARMIDGNPAFRPIRDVNPEVTMLTYGALLSLIEARDSEVVRSATRAELQRLDGVTLERAASLASVARGRRVSTFDFLGGSEPKDGNGADERKGA